MDSGHYIEKCKHGIVLSQCRCPGPRTEYIIECPAECDAMNLRAQLADRDAEIERLRADSQLLRAALGRGWIKVWVYDGPADSWTENMIETRDELAVAVGPIDSAVREARDGS